MKLWDVVYSNYEPPEIDSTHASEKEAEARLQQLDDSAWRIVGPYKVGPPSFSEIMEEAAKHGQAEAGKGHGIGCGCMDEYARKIRLAIYAAITPAERVPLTEEELAEAGQYEPNPETFRSTEQELKREWEERARIRNILRMATNRL